MLEIFSKVTVTDFRILKVHTKTIRDAGGGGRQGGHVPPQVLGYQLTLFGPRGADYACHITSAPPHLFGVFEPCQKDDFKIHI